MTYSALCFVCGEPGGAHLICRELHESQKELNEINNGGKTLRDEFAMAALVFLSDRIFEPRTYEFAAISAYEMADAMLEARKAKGE